MEKYMLPCLNKKLFGFDCPGCGMQRALQFIFHGEFMKAFHIFPAIYTTLLLFVFLALHLLDKSRNYHKLVIATAIGNAVIVIIAYIYKMTT
ncbi:MAG TPA: DUF2752 domain-containing protein [Flavobacterium sp.]|nr:DUF2752 domain-containing protein [Flavobacterium sp.]